MPPDYTAAEAKTSASRSNPSNNTPFSSQWQGFVHYAQQQIPGFIVDATNKPIAEALLAYFMGNSVQSKQGHQPAEGLIAARLGRLWQNRPDATVC